MKEVEIKTHRERPIPPRAVRGLYAHVGWSGPASDHDLAEVLEAGDAGIAVSSPSVELEANLAALVHQLDAPGSDRLSLHSCSSRRQLPRIIVPPLAPRRSKALSPGTVPNPYRAPPRRSGPCSPQQIHPVGRDLECPAVFSLSADVGEQRAGVFVAPQCPHL
jgi:hypothetical protein